MGPNDYLLLGVDRLKPVEIIESAYNDSRGVTAEIILNVFRNTNRLLRSNFNLNQVRYHSWFNPEWRRVEMYAVAAQDQEILLSHCRYRFSLGEGRTNPRRDQPQIRTGAPPRTAAFFGINPVAHFTDAKEWFSVLLFKKS